MLGAAQGGDFPPLHFDFAVVDEASLPCQIHGVARKVDGEVAAPHFYRDVLVGGAIAVQHGGAPAICGSITRMRRRFFPAPVRRLFL